MTATNITRVFAQKPFPEFITQSEVFRTVKQVNKIFPELGLKNCKKTVVLDMSTMAGTKAQELLVSLRNYIHNQIMYYSNGLSYSAVSSLRKFQEQLTSINRCMKQNSNSQITLNLYEDIVDADNRTIFKAGEGVFRVYNKIRNNIGILRNNIGIYSTLPLLEHIAAFKEFSSQNLPKRKYQIHFSSNKTQGIWDIATMSMRGIQSCQTWGKDYAHALIGSIVDPFTGIIYLTTGEDSVGGKGTKMLRRCVVRFVVHKKTKKPFIGIERMFPSHDKMVYDAFAAFIREKTGGKFEVKDLYNDGRGINGCVIPMNRHLMGFPEGRLSYRDSGVPYDGEATSVGMARRVENKVSDILNTFGKKAISALRKINRADRNKMPKQQYNALLLSTGDCRDELEADLTDLICDISEFGAGEIDSPYELINNINEALRHNMEIFITDSICNISEENILAPADRPTREQCQALAKIACAGAKAFLQKELEKAKNMLPKPSTKNKHQTIYSKYLN